MFILLAFVIIDMVITDSYSYNLFIQLQPFQSVRLNYFILLFIFSLRS